MIPREKIAGIQQRRNINAHKRGLEENTEENFNARKVIPEYAIIKNIV